MKRLLKLCLCSLLFLGLYAAAQTTTTITGTIEDLTQALVSSGKVTFSLQPSADTTQSGIARFSPQTITCLINSSGQIVSLSSGTCTVTMNTALQPTGSSYQVCYWPYNVKTACFNFYAVLSTYDWSTVVPTPTTSPAANFVDIFSNQTIGGSKVFTNLLNPSSTGTDSGAEVLQNKTLQSPTSTGTDSGAETLVNKTLISPILNTPALNSPVETSPSVNGVTVANSPGTYYAGVNGTGVVGSLASLSNGSGGTIELTPASATGGIIGVVNSVSGGVATVQQSGTTSCTFDGAATAPDYVQASSTSGYCHDAGSTFPASGQVLGRILQNISSAGSGMIDLFGPEIRPSTIAMYSENGTLVTTALKVVQLSGAMSSGTLTLTFSGNAVFNSIPNCAANDVAAAEPLQLAPSTSGVTVHGTGSDSIDGFCIGN
jgi:hypothetical protein